MTYRSMGCLLVACAAVAALAVPSPQRALAGTALPDGVGLVDPTTGEWHLRAPLSSAVHSFYYGDPGDSPFLGDWNCDDIDTPGLYRQSDGYVYLRNSNTQGIADVRFFFGNPGDVPLAGDWDGDGCDTLSLYRPAQQRFYIINELGSADHGLGAAEYWFVFGNPGDTPVVGDWDRDGIDEIGLYRESSGFFYFRDTLDTGIANDQFYFGDPADRFVAGDWGIVDGTDTPAVFRPSNTTFYFRHSLTQGNADSQFAWGNPWMIPVAGNTGVGEAGATLAASMRSQRVIGPGGGAITALSPEGLTTTLNIPAGALARDTLIELTPVTSLTGLGDHAILISAVDLAPEGLRFAAPATLTFALPAWAKPQRAEGLVFTGSKHYPTPLTPSIGSVTMPIAHFSVASVFTGMSSQVDAALTCRDEQGNSTAIETLLTDEYMQEQSKTRDIRQRILTSKTKVRYEFDETWGDPLGHHARILTLTEVTDATEPAVSHETVRVRQYGADGQTITYSSDQVDGVDVNPTTLDPIFNDPNFAGPMPLPSGEDLDRTLDVLRRTHCGYVEIAPSESIMTTGHDEKFVAKVYDKDSNLVPGAAVTWSTSNPAVAIEELAGGFANITAARVGAATITVAAQGHSRQGTAVVEVVDGIPSIMVTKTALRSPIERGGDAMFSIAIDNIGGVACESVNVSDPQCDGLQFADESQSDDLVLEVGERWTYLCSVLDVETDVTNTATVTALHGTRPATDSDTDTVVVTTATTTTIPTTTTTTDQGDCYRIHGIDYSWTRWYVGEPLEPDCRDRSLVPYCSGPWVDCSCPCDILDHTVCPAFPTVCPAAASAAFGQLECDVRS